MSLSPGTRLGPFEILSPIGSGGMGEVYKARDTRLNRTVAIKIAAVQFSDRFNREARAISALNHPNICTLHDVGPNYLVMELVEGESLAARLEKGKLPIESVLLYGAQIADGLAAAHAKGIVHRDLKPGNIMAAKSGIKILDFGLAKSSSESEGDPGQAETATASQVIVGTPAYMAPEQLEGRGCDARTDIFALGLVLYEMAAGTRAFTGRSRAELTAEIMRREPPALEETPPQFAHLVQRCLAKDPDDRWQSAHDLAIQLRSIPRTAAAAAAPASRWREWAGWLVAAAVLAGAIVLSRFYSGTAPAAATVEFTVPLPDNAISRSTGRSGIAISPNGSDVALRAVGRDGRDYLWVRPIHSSIARLLPETAGAGNFFWAPDSVHIAFFSAGKLRKIDLRGGPAVDLCDAPNLHTDGGAWNNDDSIVFTPDMTAEAWYRVSGQGGQPERIPAFPKGMQGVINFLPDGRRFLASARIPGPISPGVYLCSLGRSDVTLLVPNAVDGSIVRPSGSSQRYLVFTRDDVVMAQPFDLDRERVAGDAFALTPKGIRGLSTSEHGVLAYWGTFGEKSLMWVDRQGRPVASLPEIGDYRQIALSPDESTVALSRVDSNGSSLWLMELSRSTTVRLTSNRGSHWYPVWSPDGRRIVYSLWYVPTQNLFVRPSAGTGSDEPLLPSPATTNASSWSPDGRFVAYWLSDPRTQHDIWILPIRDGGTPFAFLQTEYKEFHPAFSPDGKWIAYTSDESGRPEIYVRAFEGRSATTGARRLSVDGGSLPRWRRDGKELFYLAPDRKLMSIEFGGSAVPVPGVPRALFQTRIQVADFLVGYAVAANGQRFLLNTPTEETESRAMTVIVNWRPSTQTESTTR